MAQQNSQQQAEQQPVSPEILTPIVRPTDTVEFLMSPIGQSVKKFELSQRMAQVYAMSTIVPQSYQGVKNIGNVIIAMDMAERMSLNPLQVMQNLYVVHGNPSWSSKFLIALFNACGRFEPIAYEFVGQVNSDQWGARAVSYSLFDREHKHRLEGPLVTIGLAKKEGWYNKAGSKWQTIPELMLRYRAAAWFINTTAPELSMGLRTTEEIEDTIDIPHEEVTISQPVRKVVFPSQDMPQANDAETKVVETIESSASPQPQQQTSTQAAEKQPRATKTQTRDSLFS